MINPTTAVFVVVACLTLQAAESKNDFSLTNTFPKPVERAARSIQPRQSSAFGSCTVQQLTNIYAGYPSDCARVARSASSIDVTDAQSVASIYSTLCIPRCNRALVRFYFECGFEALGEVFIQLCSTNANNQRCYNLIGTLNTDGARVQSSCPTSGSSCPSSCRSSIQTFRNNAGCCVNVFNTSALTELFAADDNRLWVSCSVETPGFCTQSTVIRPGSVPVTTNRPTPGTSHPTDTTSRPTSGTISIKYALSKLLAGLLLMVVMVLIIWRAVDKYFLEFTQKCISFEHDLNFCRILTNIATHAEILFVILSTVEPPNRGHFGTVAFVLSSEVVPFQRLSNICLVSPPSMI